MKEIKAIIQSSLLDKVLRALHEIKGLPGCTVSHVHGYQRSDGTFDEETFEPDERTKLEIVVRDSDAEKVIEVITKNAHTGSPGDGKIFIMECKGVVSIRTGEKGDSAI